MVDDIIEATTVWLTALVVVGVLFFSSLLLLYIVPKRR